MTNHTLERRSATFIGTVLLGLVATALGCSQTDTRSSGELAGGLWDDKASETAKKFRAKETVPIEPRKHTLDDLLSFARLSEHRGQDEQAEKLYRKAIEREPGNPVPYHRLGVMHAKRGKFQQADELFLQALRIRPANVQLISDIGYCYYLQNRLDEAEQVLGRALEMRPDDPAVGNNLALVLGEQGRDEECFAMFRRTGNEAQAHANMAFVHAQRGDLEQAKANYSRALTLNQTLRPAAEAMAQLAKYEQKRTPSPSRTPAVQTASTWPRVEAVRPVSFEQDVVR